jgi:SH3-like domain-containing protein
MAALLAACSLFCLDAPAAGAPTVGPDSHLPVPRFVSLKTEGANGRHGPGLEHRVDWIYERVGLPLQVTGESGPWRRVQDPDGGVVWMHAQNLDSRRTAYVRRATSLRRMNHESSRPVAYLAQGVVGALTACEGDWRRIVVGGRVGWVDKTALWGADDCTGL